MAKKETSTKAAEAAVVENEVKNPAAAPVEAEPSPTNENADIAQLQQEAADALNTLWDAMRRAGYRAYTGMIFMGMAFNIEKNEEREHHHYKPADLSNYETTRQREAEKGAPFVAQPAQKTAISRNIMANGGRTRSVHVGDSNHNAFVK